MQRICIPMFTLGIMIILGFTVQAQQSEWVPPLPMPMESLIVPYQNYSYSSGNGYIPAYRQLRGIARFSGLRSRGKTPVSIDSNYGYGNWQYNYQTTAPQYPAAMPQNHYSHDTNAVTVPVSVDLPLNQETPVVVPQTTEPSTVIDLPIIVPQESNSTPEIIVPPQKPRKLESEPEKIIRPRKVSEIPPPVHIPPQTVIQTTENVEPEVKVPDTFIMVEEPEMQEIAPIEIEDDPFSL